MKSVFIETNSYSRYSKGDRKIKDLLSKSNIVYISVVSLGELYYGFKKGDREGRNIGLLKSFLDDLKVKVVNVTIDTSRFYSTIKYQLVRSGTPIPENDI